MTTKEATARPQEVLPLAYRPHHFDDWGVIRSADGAFVCQVKDPRNRDEEILDAHRHEQTDPWGDMSKLIVTAVNEYDSLKERVRVLETRLEHMLRLWIATCECHGWSAFEYSEALNARAALDTAK